ncbi:putative methyltransferase Ecym_4568 [Eremothecium cymbalariae DBVPG|uniref:Sugar phosphate phosphatase n=1 Tax=Eremothecium cymbalariae (strain CBS 270.75 / DBVPG 7215 / KCTC 17166 / NRRL Y-17582) TaxID=931890 RepID=G8JS79_ERECY|nr:hypothetical protein Ecym_4568 [Eremothecium cymbalariae DBVPG\
MQSSSLPPKFQTSDANSFGQYTAEKRWPIIVQNCIDDFSAETGLSPSALAQQQHILDELEKLKREIQEDGELRPFTKEEMELSKVPKVFNERGEELGKQTWVNGEWLYCEVYLYRRILVLFRQNEAWRDYDVFESVKRETFRQSEHGVVELAKWYQSLSGQMGSELEALFQEFVEISLWGNATDLSLLTNVTLEEIQSIQGASVRSDSQERILINDTSLVWQALGAGKVRDSKQRVDFVLDNSGFELYADLLFSLFLLDSGMAGTCVLHAKDSPYMVSDTMVKDYHQLTGDLHDRSFFSCDSGKDTAARSALDFVSERISSAFSKGQLVVKEHPFWTEPGDFWELVPGHPVFEDLKDSDLVIFKGDFNYRKLTGDLRWPRSTPYRKAIGPLAQHGLRSLSLRTAKSDVIVGLAEGVDEKLCAEWEAKGNEHGSWWASSGKWAVICYSDGKPL